MEHDLSKARWVPCPGCGHEYLTTSEREPQPHERCVDCWKRRALEVQGQLDNLTTLWGQYRDEEHANHFSDEEWEAYKALFKRGPNFPDWLAARRQSEARIRRQRSWLEALREAECAASLVERFDSYGLDLRGIARLRARFKIARQAAERALAQMEAEACPK